MKAAHAACVVLATGPWAANLARRWGSAARQSVPDAVALYGARRFRAALRDYADSSKGCNFKPDARRMLHAGSRRARRSTAVDPMEYDEAADGPWLPQVRQRLIAAYPLMQQLRGGGYGALYATRPIGTRFRQSPVWKAAIAPSASRHGFKDVADRRPTNDDSSGWPSEGARPSRRLRLARFDENDRSRTVAYV